jgi:hypothetical protein
MAAMHNAQHRVRVVAADLASILAPAITTGTDVSTQPDDPHYFLADEVRQRPMPGSGVEALMVERMAAANTYMVNMAVFQSGYRSQGALFYARA